MAWTGEERKVQRLMSLDSNNIFQSKISQRLLKRNSLKPSAFEEKEAKMLNLSLDSRVLQIKRTLEQMGDLKRRSIGNVTAITPKQQIGCKVFV